MNSGIDFVSSLNLLKELLPSFYDGDTKDVNNYITIITEKIKKDPSVNGELNKMIQNITKNHVEIYNKLNTFFKENGYIRNNTINKHKFNTLMNDSKTNNKIMKDLGLNSVLYNGVNVPTSHVIPNKNNTTRRPSWRGGKKKRKTRNNKKKKKGGAFSGITHFVSSLLPNTNATIVPDNNTENIENIEEILNIYNDFITTNPKVPKTPKTFEAFVTWIPDTGITPETVVKIPPEMKDSINVDVNNIINDNNTDFLPFKILEFLFNDDKNIETEIKRMKSERESFGNIFNSNTLHFQILLDDRPEVPDTLNKPKRQEIPKRQERQEMLNEKIKTLNTMELTQSMRTDGNLTPNNDVINKVKDIYDYLKIPEIANKNSGNNTYNTLLSHLKTWLEIAKDLPIMLEENKKKNELKNEFIENIKGLIKKKCKYTSRLIGFLIFLLLSTTVIFTSFVSFGSAVPLWLGITAIILTSSITVATSGMGKILTFDNCIEDLNKNFNQNQIIKPFLEKNKIINYFLNKRMKPQIDAYMTSTATEAEAIPPTEVIPS